MWWVIAAKVAQGAIKAFQAYNQARQQQVQYEMQADTHRYEAGVAKLNRTAAANDIYSIGQASDIARSQYGQQAAQLIASTRLSAASRGVVGTTGSAAAHTAAAKFAAQRDLYSMSLETMEAIHNKRTELTGYAAKSNMDTAMAAAYEDAADEINPTAAFIASATNTFIGEVAMNPNGSQLMNYAQPDMGKSGNYGFGVSTTLSSNTPYLRNPVNGSSATGLFSSGIGSGIGFN